MSNLAINDAGDVLAFDGRAWKPAPMAQNDQGQKVVFDGASWQPLEKLVGSSKGSQAQGRSDALAGAVASGATFGTADELGATVRAALPGFSNWMMSGPALQRDESIGGSPKAQTVSNAPTYEQRREEELARMRGQMASNKEAYPALMTAGEIGGNVLGTAALSMVPGARALVTGGGASGLVGNTIRGGLTGMALGGAQGFAEGEGGFDNRAANAVMPALLGGGVGMLAPSVAKGVGYVYERAAPKLLNAIANKAEQYAPRTQGGNLSAAAPEGGPGIPTDSWQISLADRASSAARNIEEQSTLKRLAMAMSGRNNVDATQRQIGELGEGAFLADANKATKRLAFVTQANSDDAAQAMEQNFLRRNQATGTRFKAEVPGAPDPSRAEDFLSAYRSAEGSRIYDPVLRSGQPLNVTPELEALMQRPAIQQALQTVDRWATENGARLTQAERLHLVKQALNNNADAAFQSGTAVNRNMVGNTASDWEQALWRANPAIREADNAYAQIAGLHDDWFKRGQAFAARGRGEAAQNASPEALAEVLRGATPQQRQVFQAGASAEMRRIASEGGDATRRLAKVLGEGDDMVARLSQTVGPERAQAILRRGNAERTFAETYKDVMRGSQTAERQAALRRDADLMPPPTGDAGALLRWMRDTWHKLDTPPEAIRRRLADALTNSDAQSNRELLDQVRQFLREQRARPFTPGVAGSAASTAAPSQR